MVVFTSNYLRLLSLSTLACGLIVFAGCEPTVDPQVLEMQKRFVVTEEPASPVTIETAIANIATQPEVTLVGRINAGSSDPFDAKQATMVLSEVPESGHDHDPGDCPFCKKRLENAKSCIVRFVDSSGNLIQRSAQQVLGVAKNQDVVVTGKGTFLPEVDMLQVDASSIYVRPASK